MDSLSNQPTWVAASIVLSLAVMAGDPSNALSATPPQLTSATGAGHTIVSGELRTFSFVAQSLQDGTARGTAEINNRLVGEMFQVDIDCLQVVDNIAIMSGVITRHTDTTAIGLTGIFGVIDNGEGVAAPGDAVTQVFFFRPNTVTCHDATPDLVVEVAAPIVSGNVLVH